MLGKDSTPQEIMAALPVDKVVELSGKNIQVIAMLLRAKHATNHFHRTVNASHEEIKELEIQLGDEDDANKRRQRVINRIQEIVDQEWDDNPFEASICHNMSGGINHPMGAQIVAQSQGQIWCIIWAIIYEEMAKEHGVPSTIMDKLQTELIEKPTPNGVLIKGYNFTAEDLGYGDNVSTDDEPTGQVPDFIPDDILKGLNLDEDDEQC